MGRDLDGLTAKLRRHLARGSEITGVRMLSAGNSNETYLVEGLNAILRLPPSETPLLPLAFGIQRQFDIFAVVGRIAGAPPVPRLVYAEHDDTIVGAPFFMMERIEGEGWGDWGAPEWAQAAGPAALGEVSSQTLGAFSALHAHPPLEVLGPILSNGDELDRWANLVEDCDVPSLMDCMALLGTTTPALCAKPSPCHGDTKLANTLWSGSTLTALLDWELAFNGDPRWDLGYMLVPYASDEHPGLPGYDLEGLWQRSRIVARWEEVTGRASDRLLWFEAASIAKIAAVLFYGFDLSARGLASDPRFAGWREPAEQFTGLAMSIAQKDAKRQ